MSHLVTVPIASPEVAELADVYLSRVPADARRLMERVAADEDFYHVSGGVPVDALLASFEFHLRHCVEAAVRGGTIDLSGAATLSRQRARQGLPLAAMLRVWRTGGQFAIEGLVDVATQRGVNVARLVVPASQAIWRVLDRRIEITEEVYREVELELADSSEAERLRVLDRLLAGGIVDRLELERVARILDLPSAGAYLVVVCDLIDPGGVSAGAEGGALRQRLDAFRFRYAWRPGGRVCTALVALRDSGGAERLRAAVADVGRVGLSGSLNDLVTVGRAVHQAEIALTCLPAGASGVVGFGERPVTALVASASALVIEGVREVLARVLELPAADRTVLLHTLSVWFASGGSATRTAREMHVHPNTVRYRLRQLAELSGRDVNDPRDVAELYVALEAVQFGLDH